MERNGSEVVEKVLDTKLHKTVTINEMPSKNNWCCLLWEGIMHIIMQKKLYIRSVHPEKTSAMRHKGTDVFVKSVTIMPVEAKRRIRVYSETIRGLSDCNRNAPSICVVNLSSNIYSRCCSWIGKAGYVEWNDICWFNNDEWCNC